MRDPRRELLTELVTVLTPIGLPVYSFVPDQTEEPYIFIGEVLQEENNVNKDDFNTINIFSVELYTGTNEWTDSLLIPLGWINDIKIALQPYKGYVMDIGPIFNMVYLRLENDQGLTQGDAVKKIYYCFMQYECEIQQLYNEVVYENVIHNGENVIFEGENVVYLKKLK